jgi:MFS family permease
LSTIESTRHVEYCDPVEPLSDAPGLSAANSTGTIFGDSSTNYRVTIWSGASHFGRNIWTPAINDPEVDHDDNESTGLERVKKWKNTAFVLAAINLLTMVNESMLAVMVPAIIYDMDFQGFQWALAGPAIGAAATILSAGQIYACFPFKFVYLGFAVILLVAFITPAFAHHTFYLFWTRILLGIGLAGQQLGLTIFMEHGPTFIDDVRRDMYISFSTILGMMLGPLLGGLCAHRGHGWHWAFFVTTILLVLVLGLLVIHLRLPSHIRSITQSAAWPYGHCVDWTQRKERLDFVGIILSFFGILTFFIAFNFTGTLSPWTDAWIYLPIFVGIILLVLTTLSQYFGVLTSPSTALFPSPYVRSFRTMMTFALVFCTAAIYHSTIPYAALYQMLTRPNPSGIMTGFYITFTLPGPHLLATVIILTYMGSGLLTYRPCIPSYSFWATIACLFLLLGTILHFCGAAFTSSTPSTVLTMFALACIGFWSSLPLTIAHQILDLHQHPTDLVGTNARLPRQRHPHHNRCFILFAAYLGVATAMTLAGSIFMQIGPSAMLTFLARHRGQFGTMRVAMEDALTLLLGYYFTDDRVPPDVYDEWINAIRDVLGWVSLPGVVFSGLGVLGGGGLLVAKLARNRWCWAALWKDGLWGVPVRWRIALADGAAPGQDVEMMTTGCGGVGGSGK